jgi:hypothetical protein
MNTLGNIDVAGRATLGHAIKEGRLSVPSNQREYSWKQTHVRDLFDDVHTVIDDPETAEYFLGTIVVMEDPNDAERRRVVVDGQQRLATTTIFLAAVRDYFFRNNDDEAAIEIEKNYLMSVDLHVREPRAHLHLNDGDDEFFLDRVLLRPDDPKRKKVMARSRFRTSHRLINQAAGLAAAQVAEILKHVRPEKHAGALLKWIDFFETNARVIWVTVQDEQTAYVVFETMNDRGLELSATDLIKNYLFSLSGSQLSKTKHNWSKMVGILESVESSVIVKDYVRHYWISFYGRTRAPALFAAIKDEIKNPRSAIQFASNLAETAPQYVAFRIPEHVYWKPYGMALSKNVKTLDDLGLRQVRPLLLSVLRRFRKGEVRKVFQLAVSWSVRLMATGQLGRGALETDYGVAALAVEKGRITTTADLAKQMRNVIPTDDEFVNSFATSFIVTTPSHARYLLAALERTATGKADSPMLNEDPNIGLEHVVPLNPTLSEWPDFTADEQEEYVNRLGNLCLLANHPNSDLGNKSFAHKQTVLKAQSIRLTAEIGRFSTWTEKDIEKRQKRLANLAVKTWPLSV